MLRNTLPACGAALDLGLAFSLAPPNLPSIPPEAEDCGLEHAGQPERLDAPGSHGIATDRYMAFSGYSPGKDGRGRFSPPLDAETDGVRQAGGQTFPDPPGTETKLPAVGLIANPPAIAHAAASPAARTVASGSAMGSLSTGDYFPGAASPELPDKGWRFWSGGGAAREVRKPPPRGGGHYRQKSLRYRLGAEYDLSLNSIVGLSLTRERRKVGALRPDDGRNSELSAYAAGFHFDRLIETAGFPFLDGGAGDALILSGGAFYGRVKASTSGNIVIRVNNQPFLCDWREEDGRSTLYGFSGKLSYPLLYGLGWKFLPEIGFEYMKVKTPARNFAVTFGNQSLVDGATIPASASDSFLLPALFRARRDYRKNWGWASPSLEAGLVAELGRPSGAAAYNASAAQSLASETDVGGLPVGLASGAPARFSYRLGFGLDLIADNGWEMRASYSRKWNREFHNDYFRLEAGKCF
ncbi:MAG: autotransporter outer membrane beta-barrel domain-containing protein [Planctomycetota bacterium]|jgi:hypothetical protein|nr:autotransporter outer membrane beta-barrel domain-containing protein [Planctomycetota bacterium]